MLLFAFAALGAQAAMVAKVGETAYETLEAAIAAAEPVDGVVTYEICGRAEVSATGWIQVLKSGLSNVKKVAFVGTTKDAEICIAGDFAILADQKYDIDVSFRDLKLSKPNPEYGGDYGHSTKYFTTWLRNTGAAENTVTYENCTFPNGACNNQYGKTVYTNCTFANGTTGLYNLWIYGGSVEMDGGVFTGTRGMKVYTEETPATAPSVEVKGTAFSGLTEKAAIVVSKAATVKFAEVSVADCQKGLFQKDIEGSLDDQKVTVTANGSKISGSFAITANREPEMAKTEFNITGGMFTAEVPSDYCADGFTVKATTDADGKMVYGVVKEVVAATIDGTAYETLDEAITDVQDGETIVVNAGEYKLNGNLTYTGKAFTIQAAEGAKVSFDMSAAVALHGAKITFSGVTFDYKTNKDYTGLQHADTLVYNDCTVNGKVFLYAASETFNRCTFTQTAVDYNVWTYGAKAVTFNGCTFNCVGKSVLVYNEGSISKTELAVSDCKFNASASVEGKAAIEIDTSLMAGGATITVDAKTTAEGFAEGSNSKSTLWNDKKQKQDTNTNTTVTVAGETVFTPIVAKVGEKGYTTLAAALADVAEGKPLTWVAEGSWPVKTPVYYNGTFYETGTGFAAKGALERAIDAANAEGAAAVAKIYVRPGFEADELVLQAHQLLKTGLAIYGNDAKLSRNWAPCVEYPGTSGDSGAHQLTKDVSLAIYNLHNGAGFWGRRTTAYTVDLKLSGCRNAYQVMFYGNADTGVKGKTNISVTNCTFDATTKADHNVLVTIGAGTVDVSDTTFTAANINVKNVDGGDNVITVKNCTFKDTVAGNQNIRVRSYVEGTHADLTIENVTFAGDSTQNVEIGDSKAECKGVVNYTITKTSGTMNVYKQGVTTAEATTLDAAVAYSGDNVGTIADEKALRRAFFAAPTDGTAVTVTLGADITLETLYAAENFGTEKLDDNAEGDTFNRYKVGVHPTAEDPNHWNPLVTGQTQEQRLVYGAYYHMSATDERIARLVVKSGQKIVLDLNGHTIQKNARATHGDWSEVCTDIIGNYGTLEIVDSSTGTKGTVKGIGYISCVGAVLHNYAGATMTVTGVNVDGNAAGMSAGTGQYAIANEGGTLTLDGVNVHDTATSASLIMSNGGTVTIKNATLSHPAAKVINAKGGEINIESASVTSEKYAVFVTGDARVNVNGSLTIEGTGTLYVEGDAAALTKKPGVELSAPAGFTWVENDGVQVLKSFVAKVGETAYVTIAEAIAVLSAENHTLTLLNENAWDATTPVYWAAGTQSGYAATLTEALTAAYKADAGAITVVCRPGADVGEMTHGHVADDLTIYGNDAYLSGGECDLEVDMYTFSRATGAQAADGAYLAKDITITAYELDNLGVWGQRHTVHKVTVNLTDCDGKALEGKTNVQRVYISGTTGVNDITLTDCYFLTKATAVYSNADGAIKAVNCSFTDGQVPFNINHKANGTQTVAVENCRFTNCGDAGDWKQFAAPLRLVNSGAGTQSAEVMGCAFADTVGANGDILLGDGRTGQMSNDVELKVVKTAANIQAQKPGYYGGETVDATKKATAESPAEGTLETSVAKLLPVDPRTLGYATSGKAEALPATPDMNGAVVNVTAAQAQYVLDGAYGPIDGKTINFTESINDTLILGRASKYDGSKTVYRHGSHAGEALSYADFIAYKNQSVWTESCYYERTVENVTFTANEGVTVKNFEADGGEHIYAGTAPVYDYVRDTGSWVTEGSCYYKRAILKNITFKGLTFWAKTDINTSESTTVYDGFTFTDCTFDLGTTADGNQAIRYYNENNNGNVKNLVVEGCTFKTCSQGVYTAHVKNVTVTGSTFDTTGHNAIAIQDHKGPCDHGKVVITGNTFKNIGDRIIRFNNVGMGTTVTITGNTADGNSGKLDKATGKREIVKATTLPVNAADSIKASGNDWGANTVVEGVFIDDYATKLGTEACPYSREQFAAMTRADYIAAQERLGGTLYVNVGNYAYEKNGVLGNGVRDDTTGQVPDHSKLNAYGENGYLGEKNDGANGHAVVFVGGTITSDVTGYTSIDSIGTSLLLAVPAYTKVTFKGTAFKNVLSFDYQLYTSPWSQLGGLTFNGCTFDGIIVGAIASQELAFNGCTFNNYVNTTDANSSNPTWIRPAYGNWTKGDNEGQGTDFRSLTKITFENNTVTSTRPVKFERIAQWEMATTVTATNNTFAITPQEGDKVEKKTKNVGLYFGANAKFDLVVDENKKSGETAALYTAVYSAPNGTDYDGLPAGSTVKNAAGEDVTIDDARVWKKTDTLTLKTTVEVASVTNAKGVSVAFATLADALAAAKDGETVTLLADVNGDGIVVPANAFPTGLVVDFAGHTYTVGGLLVGSSTTKSNGFQLLAGNKITFKNGSLVGAPATAGEGTEWTGAPAILIQNYCDLTLEQMTVKGGDETCYTLSNNNGEIVIDGSTIVAGKGTKYGPFAFDVCRYASYPSVHVTVKGASVIEGDVEISGTIGDNQSRQLDIEGGTFKGAFTVVNQPANITISGGTFATAIDEAYCAAGFIPTKNADGTFGVKEGAYVAQVGTTKYDTVDAAMEAAAANETATTVKLLAESVDETVVPTWYIKGDVTVDADSAVKATFAPIENAADAPDTDGMAYIASDDAEKARTITVGEKVTLSFPNTAKETGAFYIGYGKDGKWAPTHLVLNGRIEAYEPYIGVGSSLTVSKTGSLKSLSECLLMRRGSTVTVTGTDGAWSAEKPQVALGYGSQQGGEVTFKDTFVTGGAFWTMWNRNGNADVATKLTLDNTAFTAGAFKGTASSGETSAYQVELKNGAKMTIAGDFAVIAEGAVTIESGSLLTAKSISNAGTLTVRADALTDAVRVVDYTGTGAMTLADYGTVKAEGGELYVEDNDLWIRRPAVAEIGTVKYATLAAAIAAAQAGETVTLLADITLASKQSIRKELTLDLNGKTLTGTAYQTLSLGSGANVTIQDSSAEKTGKVANGYKGSADPYTICLDGYDLDGYDAAALTLVSGTVEANPLKTDLQSVAINTNNKKDGPYAINIRGGKVFVPESSTNGRAIVAGKNVTLTVEGGEIVGGLHGVDVYGDSTTAITGGSISARVVDTGVIKAAYGLRAKGTASVTIGAADGTADGVSVAGIKMDDDGYMLDVPAVTVNSGTIAGPVYSITKGTIGFTVQATSEDVLRFADDTAAKFLPSNLELRAKDIDGKTMYYVAAKPVAAIGAIDYATLADAIAAAKDGETVKLLADVNGDGIAIAPNTFKTGLTVDFGGHTYTVGGLLVGSSGTASNGFQLNAGNRITFKNGAIVGATATAGAGTDWKGAPAILIQNYCDLTLEQMTVKGGDETCYTLSNNNGEIVIDGSTIVAGKGTKYGPFAFDVCRYASYPSVHVTVKGASVIEGDVEISGTIGDNQSRQLDIEGGTFKGAFTVAGNIPANIAISGGTFSDAVLPEYCASGFIPTANDDGTYGVKAGAYVAVTLGGEKKEMPFPDAWLAANIGADAATWTTAALEEKAANELAKWQCYLFGLDPNKKEAKVVATAGQGTDETIPLAVANADASASPLVTGGYVTVAYALMGSNDGTAWTQVATSDKRDGLAIPLTGTTYKFYRVDVTVTSAEGN